MTWLQRTRETISFVSPGGNTFDALWIKNNRTLDKNLGIFELPKRTGAKVQDLDTGAERYPITFYFDGSDNDIISERFFQSCKERGEWDIVHPTKGRLSLQLMSVTEQIDPTENGNLTQFSTQWILPTPDSQTTTPAQLSGQVLSGITDINESAFSQFVNIIKQNKASETASLKTSISAIRNNVLDKLSPLYEVSDEIAAQVLSISRGITDTISQTEIDTGSLAGQMLTLVQLPALVTNNAQSRLAAYSNLIDSIFKDVPDKPDQSAINDVAAQEISLTASLAAIAKIGSTSDLSLRTESIGLIESIFNKFELITNYLDDNQEVFIENDIDVQYFSQSESFSDTSKTLMKSVQFLLRQSFDLSIEKRFILKANQAPIITTIKEYGTLGENDSNFDFYIDTNQLKGNDIRIQKAGSEVVVYV